MKTVPTEPTIAMCAAYRQAMQDYIGRLPPEARRRRKAYPRGYIVPETDKIAIRWRAMLAAAPLPEIGHSDPGSIIRRLKERIQDAEIALATWDSGRNSEYWLRHPAPAVSNGES